MKNSQIYLDYAAATPIDNRVLKAMEPYFSKKFYNASAVYLDSRQVRKDIDSARAKVAFWLGCRPSEIVFTAGGTESDNMAISGIMQNFPDSKIVLTSIEHEAVINTSKKYQHATLNVDKHGRVSVSNLAKLIDDDVVLISIIYANNEIGTIQPLGDISKLISEIRIDRAKRKVKLPLYLHTDASQAAQYLDLHINRLGVDLMSLNSGKIYGPKQTGALFIKSGVDLQPTIEGGGQERGLRSGTENTASIIGFAEAMNMVQESRVEESKRVEQLRDKLQTELSIAFKDIVVHGGKRRLPNNLSFSLEGIDGERVVMELDELNLQAATGSACSALKDQSSHVLKAIGLSEEMASSSLRFSLGRQTTSKQIEQAIERIKKVLDKYKVEK